MHETMTEMVGLLAMVADDSSGSSAGNERFLRFLGRLHPLVVHFPIALGVSAAFVELINILRRKPTASPFAFTATGIAAVFAVIAAIFGWLNADFEGAGPKTTLFLHRWLGVISAGALVAVFFCGIVGRTGRRISALNAYRWGLLIAAVLTGVGAHFGGEMVYGRGYLTKVLFSGSSATAPEESKSTSEDEKNSDSDQAVQPAKTDEADVQMVSFQKDVLPIFNARCVECHGADKVKGDLRLDTAAVIFSGDRSWWTVEPGDAEKSILVERIVLPADDPDVMPPKGDMLDAAQIKTIRDWINQGAQYEVDGKMVKPGGGEESAAAQPEPETAKTDEKPATEPKVPAIDQAAIDQAVASLRERGALVMPIAQDTDAWEINASLVKPPFGDADLALMGGMEPVLEWVNLGRTAVTDAGMPALRGFERITKIRLDHTAITDAGLEPLAALPALEVVNLFGSKISDAGLKTLAEVPTMKTVYCAGTDVTPAGLAAVQSAHPGIQFVGPAETTPDPDPEPEAKPDAAVADGKVIFASNIAPILNDRCVSCHQSGRAKGGLRLDSAKEIFSGDRANWVVDPGNADKSILVSRIILPAGHEDVMPPKGEVLTEAQIDLIKTWINEGAVYTVDGKDVKPS